MFPEAMGIHPPYKSLTALSMLKTLTTVKEELVPTVLGECFFFSLCHVGDSLLLTSQKNCHSVWKTLNCHCWGGKLIDCHYGLNHCPVIARTQEQLWNVSTGKGRTVACVACDLTKHIFLQVWLNTNWWKCIIYKFKYMYIFGCDQIYEYNKMPYYIFHAVI